MMYLSAALFYVERSYRMNAIYTRQSVDRADSISIESQIEFCKYEMRGEAYKVYTDRGYSGKNTDRPAFAEMMNDIENGIISKVVVYKLDRISRSILDFSTMMERFEKYKVEFVSTTEKFDTSSPMGRAMLNICIVLLSWNVKPFRNVSQMHTSHAAKRASIWAAESRMDSDWCLQPSKVSKPRCTKSTLTKLSRSN